MKKGLIIAGAMLISLIIGAGGFWGGMNYAENRADQVFASFVNERGRGTAGQFSDGVQLSPGMLDANRSNSGTGFRGAGGTLGEVTSIEGSVLTLSTSEDEIIVHLTEETAIQKTVSGTSADLPPGTQVLVTGETGGTDGVLIANQVQILDGSFLESRAPAEMQTEP